MMRDSIFIASGFASILVGGITSIMYLLRVIEANKEIAHIENNSTWALIVHPFLIGSSVEIFKHYAGAPRKIYHNKEWGSWVSRKKLQWMCQMTCTKNAVAPIAVIEVLKKQRNDGQHNHTLDELIAMVISEQTFIAQNSSRINEIMIRDEDSESTAQLEFAIRIINTFDSKMVATDFTSPSIQPSPSP